MQKNKCSTGAQVSVRTQESVLPQVRYHPSIQTPGDGARPKTTQTTDTRTSKTQRTRPGAEHPTHTGSQHLDNTTRPDLVPTARPHPGGGRKPRSQTPDQKPKKKLVQTSATDPGPSQKADQFSNRACPRPEQVPPGLGVQVDRAVVDEVEVLTRGQRTNPDWFSWRRNRITASVAHSVAHCRFVQGKSQAPPTCYLTAITGEGRRVRTRAMSWGVDMEAEAVRRYQEVKSAALGRPVTVQDCGLFVDAQRPWLAASPDGIVRDSLTGQWLLEVKCPYKHRQSRVEDACRDDPGFCLEIQDGDGREAVPCPLYHLKTSHSYFTQIQCQLAVTGLRRADLVLFTTKETAIVPVTFDPDMWGETVSRLEMFYRDAVLPHLREKMQRETSAAWTPEQ
ncbi:uncharacterized protein LOC133003994 [Limanda limanda]|uniref:uncharacterized protein LOC133003994 n=1 Tax=Limanda limanda TaxID=27771 RepID=UPI0029C8057D|nr:uncharacterized protein LOC133003994 [Limanda limanda]